MRLSQLLAAAQPAEGAIALASAIAGLRSVHDVGRDARLDRHVAAIGSRDDWLRSIVEMPYRIGERLSLAPPALPVEDLVERLRPVRRALVKWDARPGNAVVHVDASVRWIDWEHCGCRDPLDDLVWLFCDEYTPDWPDVEERLLAHFLPAFAGRSSTDYASDYLATFGTLHSCVRLALILEEKADGPWWSAERCLAEDRVGVTLDMARRTARRAARWAARGSLTGDLSSWLAETAHRLEQVEL